MKLDEAIDGVRQAEADLARRLRTVGERHAAEQDVYHLGHTLARRCAEHVRRLAPFAERYGARAGEIDPDSPGLLESARHKGAELLGRSTLSGSALLHDLRGLYLAAQETEIAWLMLIQAAQAVRDAELLATAQPCHAETETCAKWARSRIKELAPQVYAAG
jgi:hypothetical protein